MSRAGPRAGRMPCGSSRSGWPRWAQAVWSAPIRRKSRSLTSVRCSWMTTGSRAPPTARAEQGMAHVIEHFGEQAKALDVTADGLVAYAQRRREAGAASATVKNELPALRRTFNLAVRAGRLPQRPAFPVLEARNRRVGFFERADFERVLAHLPAGVTALAEFLYSESRTRRTASRERSRTRRSRRSRR